MSFNTKLTDLLKTNPNFVDDEGDLLLAAVQDKAWKLDHDLIRLLLSDGEMKAKFFDVIDGVLLFNTNLFIDYVTKKDFLDNSYTRFSKNIGLAIDGKNLSERDEVVLEWAFKDCVLEGGQTKEDERRKELFFNEILAQDEINRLLDPKVLTNFYRQTTVGAEPVKEFVRNENGDVKENLMIKGNNLIALHVLKLQFQAKVKLIYIDPPYNLGGGSFGYNDKFNHSSWLTFMRNRLLAARELLRDDGSIWINIDDTEAHYLKILCDEIFGRENFLANIVWQKKFSPQNDAKYFSDNHDHILVFSKKKELWRRNLLPVSENAKSRYANPDNDSRGVWSSGDLTVKTYTPSCDYPITTPSGRIVNPAQSRCWMFTKERFDELVKDNRIWFGKNGGNVPRLKQFQSEIQAGTVPVTVWLSSEVGHNQEARQDLKKKFDGRAVFDTPKPERLIKRILEIGSNVSDLVLDFFSGSGTTGAVALKMKRQFILCEQMNYVEDVTVENIKKVIAGDRGGVSKSVNWQGGGNFIYCELMKYNQSFIDRIQEAENSDDLLQIWKEMAENSFLNWYINPGMPEEAINDFIQIGKEDNGLIKQKKLLIELLDKNQLYVNLSEIDDTQFKVSDADKALNRQFYGVSND